VAQIEADSGIACGLRPCGIVVPFRSVADRDAYATARWGQPLDRAGLERQIAGIGTAWRAGLLFDQDGQIDNRRQLMRSLERACVQRGVRIEEGGEVQALERDGAGCLAGVWLRDARGTARRVAATRAVLCCGAWSARLLPQLPIAPVKGQMLSLQAPRAALRRVIFGPGTYLVPRQDGLVVVGATSEPEAGFGEGLTPAGQRQLQAGIAELLPAAALWPPMERWWGFRPGTPDGAPLLGEGPVPGLWLAAGHHRNGVLLAAITAELLGAALDPAGPDPRQARLLASFRWDRFQACEARPPQPSLRHA